MTLAPNDFTHLHVHSEFSLLDGLGRINDLVDLAIQQKDHASNNFLQWFVAEQVEEEASADAVIQQVKLAGNGGGLFMVDRELGTRVFVPLAVGGE